MVSTTQTHGFDVSPPLPPKRRHSVPALDLSRITEKVKTLALCSPGSSAYVVSNQETADDVWRLVLWVIKKNFSREQLVFSLYYQVGAEHLKSAVKECSKQSTLKVSWKEKEKRVQLDYRKMGVKGCEKELCRLEKSFALKYAQTFDALGFFRSFLTHQVYLVTSPYEKKVTSGVARVWSDIWSLRSYDDAPCVVLHEVLYSLEDYVHALHELGGDFGQGIQVHQGSVQVSEGEGVVSRLTKLLDNAEVDRSCVSFSKMMRGLLMRYQNLPVKDWMSHPVRKAALEGEGRAIWVDYWDRFLGECFFREKQEFSPPEQINIELDPKFYFQQLIFIVDLCHQMSLRIEFPDGVSSSMVSIFIDEDLQHKIQNHPYIVGSHLLEKEQTLEAYRRRDLGPNFCEGLEFLWCQLYLRLVNPSGEIEDVPGQVSFAGEYLNPFAYILFAQKMEHTFGAIIDFKHDERDLTLSLRINEMSSSRFEMLFESAFEEFLGDSPSCAAIEKRYHQKALESLEYIFLHAKNRSGIQLFKLIVPEIPVEIFQKIAKKQLKDFIVISEHIGIGVEGRTIVTIELLRSEDAIQIPQGCMSVQSVVRFLQDAKIEEGQDVVLHARSRSQAKVVRALSQYWGDEQPQGVRLFLSQGNLGVSFCYQEEICQKILEPIDPACILHCLQALQSWLYPDPWIVPRFHAGPFEGFQALNLSSRNHVKFLIESLGGLEIDLKKGMVYNTHDRQKNQRGRLDPLLKTRLADLIKKY